MQLGHRFLNVVEDLSTDENNYRSIAVNSFGQLIRIISFVIVLFVIISIVFNVSASEIFTVIGAITAIFLLVFRDPILGFVAGIHAASSRMVKKGDWVYFPKYNLEGYVKEINLISIKIESFDKTFSTIPTYDIISSELKNNEPIHKNNRRMIKRSIFLNINSFKFLGNEDLQKFEENILIGNYIKKKQNEYSQMNLNQPATPQTVQKQLTNIGLFRVYVYQYLLIHNHIVKDDILLVRQREISTQGLPLEIFCFANTSEWEAYEKIQSDIFDFILTSAKEFGLEVVQMGLK
jgi:miniconductance mechanosensitive channel